MKRRREKIKVSLSVPVDIYEAIRREVDLELRCPDSRENGVFMPSVSDVQGLVWAMLRPDCYDGDDVHAQMGRRLLRSLVNQITREMLKADVTKN